MSPRREMDQLVKDLRRQGLRVEQSKRGHYKAYCPDGLVILSLTPGSARALTAAKADLRRYGVTL